MEPKKLVKELNKYYKCKLWAKHDKYRIYFNHTSKVTTYIDLEVLDNKVIDVYAKCFYTGKTPSSYKWIKNYIESAEEYINEICSTIEELISD